MRLDRRVELGRQLADLADEPLERPGRPRAEQLDERTRRTGVSAREQGERRAHHADPGEERARDRGHASPPEQPRLRRRSIDPLHRRIDQHEAGDLLGVTRGIAAHDETAERMSDEDDALAGADGGPRPGTERGRHRLEVVEDARERPGR